MAASMWMLFGVIRSKIPTDALSWTLQQLFEELDLWTPGWWSVVVIKIEDLHSLSHCSHCFQFGKLIRAQSKCWLKDERYTPIKASNKRVCQTLAVSWGSNEKECLSFLLTGSAIHQVASTL
jgi:hypothetical protein